MDLITFDPGGYHVSLDTLWEFEAAILADARVKNKSQSRNFFPIVPNIAWRTLYGLYKSLPMEPAPMQPGVYRRDMFAVIMGPNFRKTMPQFLLPGRKSLYLFDAWPDAHEKICLFAGACRLNHLFLSSSGSAKELASLLPGTACHWIPEGVDPNSYLQFSVAHRGIDVLQLGRRYDRYHQAIAEPLEKAKKNYLYERERGKIIFPSRDSYLMGLARSKISICVPSTLTHPHIAGEIETMTARYLQSMASKCLIVGHAPKEMIEIFGYNPVIEIDYGDPAGQLLHLLNRMDEQTDLIEKNYQAVLDAHTWKHRWEKIADILWGE